MQTQVSFKTQDGRHYLCAEPDGRVVADRTAVGGWEEWTVEYFTGGDVALKSAHGRYLCAEPDGSVVADRPHVGPWELWRLVADEAGVGFLSAHGGFLVAELGGGGAVKADRHYSGPGPWEIFVPSHLLSSGAPGGPVPSGPLTRLRVESNRRYFANDAGRFDWREVTAFSLLSRLLRGEIEYVRQWLRARRAEGFTITRVMLTLDGGYWAGPQNPLGQSFRCAPDMPDYWQMLDLLVRLHAEAGLYMRACYLGALEPFGGVWYPDRRDVFEGDVQRRAEAFVVEAAQRLGAHALVVGELANEPTQIGLRHSWPKLVALGRRVKAVAPDMLLCGGEDNEGRGLVAPFDFADAHLERDRGIQGWRWLKRNLSEHWVIDQPEDQRGKGLPADFRPMPFVAGENINMGEDRADGNLGDGAEKQPSVCFGVAALSRARRIGGVCFHYDGGLWTTEPKAETPACLAAWHAGFEAFPMLTDAMWRGQWGLARGDYWRDTWPGDDDPAGVERHIREGRGPWRACGCGPYSVLFPMPKGWDWRRQLDAPADLVAINTDGVFDVAVFRRQ